MCLAGGIWRDADKIINDKVGADGFVTLDVLGAFCERANYDSSRSGYLEQ